MFCIIVALAMTAQAPSPKSDAELRAIAARVHQEMMARAGPRPAPKPAPAGGGVFWNAAPGRGVDLALPLDRKGRLRAQVAAQERAQAEAARRYQAEAQAQYQRMLPYMLESQRQYLDRLSAAERNAALHRLAGAAESEAQTYQWRMWQLQQRAR